ncbi:hypothetical protein Phum_PHUM532010 [Pediculus humanus corporis]|uniref:Uncharacterized protein n=1 Tax=Pediculus humanus subsp. corporis TaxID=121224 RepID=E0VZG1_PEDHC|nr:uncharacterized protein Phum_PHUM532010 [Pediculus humanus corporis]EEB18767.1 hypothetical protein Phum_PHUM532010 [Pediculus humanus corporis]
MPRKRSYKMKKTRHGSTGSESQSPLLPGSSGDSWESNFSNGSRRPSAESGGGDGGLFVNVSVPISPENHDGDNIGIDADGCLTDRGNKSHKNIKCKSWELEKFLKEYRSLQDQLYKMKESCEILNEDNIINYKDGDERNLLIGLIREIINSSIR